MADGGQVVGTGGEPLRLARTTTPGPGPGAPVVVLLHAFPLDRSVWDDVVPLLAARCRVVAVDLPGLGGSPVPADEPDLDVAVRGVVAALDEEGAASSAVVVGLSTGGYVAARMVGLAPGRVAGLGLLGTTTRVGPPDDPDERRATAAQVLGTEGLDAVMGSVDEGLSEAARHDTTDALVGFPGPVLLLFGEHDAATPPGVRGRELHDARPDARLVVVPGSGHLTALEAPEAVAAAVLGLVDTAVPGGAGG